MTDHRFTDEFMALWLDMPPTEAGWQKFQDVCVPNFYTVMQEQQNRLADRRAISAIQADLAPQLEARKPSPDLIAESLNCVVWETMLRTQYKVEDALSSTLAVQAT